MYKRSKNELNRRVTIVNENLQSFMNFFIFKILSKLLLQGYSLNPELFRVKRKLP